MTLAAFWAWVIANKAALSAILLILSELLGAVPQVKANGILSFVILQLQQRLKANSEPQE